jgi:hypothetical protein
MTIAQVTAKSLLKKAIKSVDVLFSVEQIISQIEEVTTKFDFLILLSDYFITSGDNLRGISYLESARKMEKAIDKSRVKILVEKLINVRQLNDAAKIVLNAEISHSDFLGLNTNEKKSIIDYVESILLTTQKSSEHGQDLLISYLNKHIKKSDIKSPLVLIEIGTTRENLPGQGSTAKLAELCQKHSLHFITVDMDPHNTHCANELFKEMGVTFDAVTAEGEDYLREYQGVIDFVFLDAYDFDHGMHSDLRQSRYEKYLGAAISDEACHQMHLDCAQSVKAKLAYGGLVCVDDTWLDEGKWMAKGTLAMPYLLNNGFKLMDVRNRAALLARDHQEVDLHV